MIKKIPFSKLISRQQPFFLYDERKLISNIATVAKFATEMLATEVSLAFSLKTQPNYKIIETIRKSSLSLDVSSLNELNYALSLGFEPSAIFLGGVGLNDASIELALGVGIGGIHLNSLEIFDKTFVKKARSNSLVNLSIRFHPEYLKGTKLGETKSAILNRFQNTKSLDGLHVYIGREAFEKTTVQELFNDLAQLENAGVFQQDWTLYFGPGLPDLEQTKLNTFVISHNVKKIKIEVGRSITSSCGYYGAPILSVKQFSNDRKTVILDGGLQHFGSPWVNLRQGPIQMKGIFCDSQGRLIRGNQTMAAIYGSLCLWHDCLHPNFLVPTNIKRGDWMMVPHMGAYGLTAGVPLFIGETLPIEFYFDGKQFLDVTHHNFGATAEE